MKAAPVAAFAVVLLACAQARAGIPVVGGPLDPLLVQQVVATVACQQAEEGFRVRENTKELTGSKAAMLSERVSKCVEQRMKSAASESTNQQRKGE